MKSSLTRQTFATANVPPIGLGWPLVPFGQRPCCRYRGLTEGRAIATQVLESFPTCPIAEIARLGRTLRAWRGSVLGLLHHGPSQQRRH
jgi:hypothetical protein